MRVSARIADPGSVKRQALKKVNPVVRRNAEDIGRKMVSLSNQEMAGAFNLGRPGNRRRHPNSRRASTALDYRLTGSELPLTVQYRVLGGEDVLRRIIIMNWGSRPHTISPNGNAGGNGRTLAWQEDGNWVNIQGSVQHPGTAPTGFLERAMQGAVRSQLRR